jgi:hypothetical protein
MWVRRSESEIADIQRRNRRRRLNPLGPFLAAVVVMLLVFLFPRSPRSGSFFTSPAFSVTFLIAFTLFYLSRALRGRYYLFGPRFAPPNAIDRSMICPRCQKVQLETATHSCACGGELEDLEYWRWTDPNHAPPAIAGN